MRSVAFEHCHFSPPPPSGGYSRMQADGLHCGWCRELIYPSVPGQVLVVGQHTIVWNGFQMSWTDGDQELIHECPTLEELVGEELLQQLQEFYQRVGGALTMRTED